MFWQFFLESLFAAAIFPLFAVALTFSFLLFLSVALPFVAKRFYPGVPIPLTVAKVPVVVMSLLYIAITTGWAAYMASKTIFYAPLTGIPYSWPYHMTGFLFCNGSLASFFYIDTRMADNGLGVSSAILAGVAMYVVFLLVI